MTTELAKLIKRAKRTMDGDSNDAEHDALVDLVDYLERTAEKSTAKVAKGRGAARV